MASDSSRGVPPGSAIVKVDERPRSATQVRAEIEKARAQIAASMTALREEVAHRTDWREWVRARPALCIGAAVAIGFWLGYRGNRR